MFTFLHHRPVELSETMEPVAMPSHVSPGNLSKCRNGDLTDHATFLYRLADLSSVALYYHGDAVICSGNALRMFPGPFSDPYDRDIWSSLAPLLNPIKLPGSRRVE
jgi:hypothetical protein